jgi:alpha-L-rhamnosidase
MPMNPTMQPKGKIMQNGTGCIRVAVVVLFTSGLAQQASAADTAASGTVTNDTDAGGTNWTAHTFEKSETFSIIDCGPVDVLAVAGGGGGGGVSGSRFKNGGNGGSGIVIVRHQATRQPSGKGDATNNAAPANVTASPASRAASVKPSESEIQASQRLQGAFVWTQADPPAAQTYAAFRKTFESDKALSSATLRIFGDTRYLLWINGQYVSRGPCRFDPKRPEYDVLEVAKYLRRGRNVMVVLTHYYAKGDGSGFNGNARLMQHRPGLAAELELTQPDGSATRLKTDASWRCTTQTRHLPSPESYGSVYDRIDARLDLGDWTEVDFDDSNWPAAVPLAANGWEPLHSRSIPLLREVEVDNLSLVKVEKMAVELGPLTNRWPLKLAAGARVVVDCGRAVQGYTVLDLEASAGSQLEVDYTVRLRETKGPDGGPNRYTARAGRQTYMSTDTHGCKYIVLTVTNGDITLRGLRVVDRRYPFDRLGRFASNDNGRYGLDRIWQIGVRTVELCSEDSIVDCAERERGQWIADGFMMGYPVSRVALAGPGQDGRPDYADGRLLKNMLRHLAFGQMPDGRIRPLRPCEYPVDWKHGVIDDYSCIWVHAVAEYYRRDADLEFVREVWPVMVKQLDYFLKRRTDRGLVYANEFCYFNNPLIYVTCEGATINAYIYRSLRDAAELGLAAGDTQNAARFADAADQLREAYNRELWDDGTEAYHAAVVRTPVPPVAPDCPPSYSKGYSGPKDTNGLTPPTGHAAAIALYYDLVPAERRARVLAYMQKQFFAEGPFPYTCVFYLENLYRQDTDEMDRIALKTIREKWEVMTHIETGTTSERFGNASFVHESGAHPAYFLSSYILGVRTEGPREARQLLIDPRLGDLTSAEGTTLTEFGPVTVHWERDANLSLSFEIVNGTTVPAMLSLRLPANTSLMIDGKSVVGADLGLKDGRMHFSLLPGRHGGRVKRE